METTTIEVRDQTWRALNRRKESGQSFDDVVSELLETTQHETHAN